MRSPLSCTEKRMMEMNTGGKEGERGGGEEEGIRLWGEPGWQGAKRSALSQLRKMRFPTTMMLTKKKPAPQPNAPMWNLVRLSHCKGRSVRGGEGGGIGV